MYWFHVTPAHARQSAAVLAHVNFAAPSAAPSQGREFNASDCHFNHEAIFSVDPAMNTLFRCRGAAAVGVKRSLDSTEAELTDVTWRQLLGYGTAQESTLNSERLKRTCVIGAGKLGSSLAESLVSKPGLAQVAVHMSIGGKDTKFEIMPV